MNVSWHDAIAYCRWLSDKTGQTWRLPTEVEWEKAAGWDENVRKRRIWPWGDEWDPRRCNTREGGPWDTTPVGQYSPAGDSPYGVADMAGNVYEWCQSLHKPYPCKADDSREDLEASGSRILRGGSWLDARWYARCAYRRYPAPEYWYETVGFRVVVVPSPGF